MATTDVLPRRPPATRRGRTLRNSQRVFERLEPRRLLDAGPLVISELSAINNSGLTDGDGEFSDWIEIHNPTAATVDLDGWYLTDDDENLAKWQFPDISMAPGQYRVVFASGKDRADPGELHTNFQLDGDGEYLALVRPDHVTIAHQFHGEFPGQYSDISYGLVPGTVETLLSDGAPAKATVPTDGSLGSAWTGVGFVDSTWTAGNTGVGYETGVREKGPIRGDVEGSSGQIKQGQSGLTGEYFDDSNLQQLVSQRVDETIDFTEADWGDGPPGTGVVEDDSYSERWTGFVHAPATGDWTFYTTSNDGVRLWIDDVALIDHWDTHVATEDSGTIRLDAGWHSIRLEHFQLGGSVVIQLSFSGPGQSKAIVPSTHLNTEPPPLPSYEDLIGVDLRDAMLGVSETAYIRIPFVAADPTVFDALTLRMQYDDGFVAYLNGVEVARRNAPETPAWNSGATANHPDAQAVVFEDIDISAHAGRLRQGNNVLAVHGLNQGAADPDFLILPELVASGSEFATGQHRYFPTPTPGAPNGDGLLGIIDDTAFSHDRGFYEAPFDLEITAGVESATIVYTTDGSEPSPSHGDVYTGPIPIDTTTVLRAMAYKEEYQATNIDTQTYVFLGALDGSDNGVVNQPANVSGYPNPRTWAGGSSYVNHDYEMDPAVVYDPDYRGVIHDSLRAVADDVDRLRSGRRFRRVLRPRQSREARLGRDHLSRCATGQPPGGSRYRVALA